MDMPSVTPAEKEKWGKMIENYLHTSTKSQSRFSSDRYPS